MLNIKSWKTGTAAFLALALTSSAVVPLVSTAPAFAQTRYPGSESYNRFVPSGTAIKVQYDKDKILLMPDERVPLTLTVAEDVIGNDRRVLIPRGSELKGELRPAYRGSQFVGKELTMYRDLGNTQVRPYYINATSNVVTRTEEVKKGANTTRILTGTAIGAGAAAALAALTGDRSISALEVLGGAGLGTIGGWLLNRKTVKMVAVYPEQDLSVRLRSDLALR
ncbi:hypothetical protein [Allocoleopsis sp.]|uniref:hypothetical protein n=1 Tax=Allocoleopsis sp. TaxID=3088169 RepID=UPI002FCFAEC9